MLELLSNNSLLISGVQHNLHFITLQLIYILYFRNWRSYHNMKGTSEHMQNALLFLSNHSCSCESGYREQASPPKTTLKKYCHGSAAHLQLHKSKSNGLLAPSNSVLSQTFFSLSVSFGKQHLHIMCTFVSAKNCRISVKIQILYVRLALKYEVFCRKSHCVTLSFQHGHGERF